MILTSRAGLVALLCVLPIGVSPWPAETFTVLLCLLLLALAADVALAASTRRLGWRRLGDGAARLGQAVDATLVVENAGRRAFRGWFATRGHRRPGRSRAATS